MRVVPPILFDGVSAERRLSGGGEMKAGFRGVAVWGVLEKRLWGRFRVALRNRLKTKDSFGCDCGAAGVRALPR